MAQEDKQAAHCCCWLLAVLRHPAGLRRAERRWVVRSLHRGARRHVFCRLLWRFGRSPCGSGLLRRGYRWSTPRCKMWGAGMVRGRLAAAGGAVWRRPAARGASAARPQALLAAQRLSSSSAEAEWSVSLSDRAARRIHAVSPDSPLLRLGVESGGCSGFSYKFEIDDVVATDKDRCRLRSTLSLCQHVPRVPLVHLNDTRIACAEFLREMVPGWWWTSSR